MPMINEINLLDILMSHFHFNVLSQLRKKELHELRNVCTYSNTADFLWLMKRSYSARYALKMAANNEQYT